MADDYGVRVQYSNEYQQDVIGYVKENAFLEMVRGLRENWVDKPVAYMLTSADEKDLLFDRNNYCLKARAINIEYQQIYIPVFEGTQMPKDVFKCNFCCGYTKNDMRGHCCACGGPRDDSYLDG